MKRILCPTDFSVAANNAVVYAAKLSRRLGADLYVAHVKLLAELTPEEAILGVGWADEQFIEEKLENACLEVAKVFKLSCYPTSTVGNFLPKSISNLARDYDMVVMGSNGQDDTWQYLFGSNTYRVAKQAAVPVFMIPEKCGYTDIDHIVFAYDYWRAAQVPLTQVVRLAKAVGARLTILQVMELSFSLKAEQELKAEQDAIQRMYCSDVSLQFRTVHSDNVAESVNEFVKREGADVLALGIGETPSRRLFHRSSVRTITNLATYPVFTFHVA